MAPADSWQPRETPEPEPASEAGPDPEPQSCVEQHRSPEAPVTQQAVQTDVLSSVSPRLSLETRLVWFWPGSVSGVLALAHTDGQCPEGGTCPRTLSSACRMEGAVQNAG